MNEILPNKIAIFKYYNIIEDHDTKHKFRLNIFNKKPIIIKESKIGEKIFYKPLKIIVQNISYDKNYSEFIIYSENLYFHDIIKDEKEYYISANEIKIANIGKSTIKIKTNIKLERIK